MQNIYELGFTSPCSGKTDAESIQAAIDLAKETGINKTVIPRYNKGAEMLYWVVDSPVRIPSDFVLELDNCEVRLTGKGSFEICGENGTPAESVQLFGSGNARICGEPEANRPLILLENAKRVTVCDFAMKNEHTRGILCRGTSCAVIKDIWFLNELASTAGCMAAVDAELKNTGGITVAGGCDNVTIENIFGTTIGDTVEITTFSCGAPREESMICEDGTPQEGAPQGGRRITGESTVRDISVKNVRTDCFIFSNISLKNGDGNRLCNVTADGVTDLSQEKSAYRAKAAVSIGETVYGFRPSELGETRNITVKNIVSRGVCAVGLINSVQDVTIADITVKSDGGAALGCPKTLLYNNIYLCNVKFDPRDAAPYPIEEVRKSAYIETPLFPGKNFYPYRAVCNMRDIHGFNFKINGVYADMVDNILRITGKNHIELYDVDIADIVYDDFVGDDCTVD